jgi:hypothetical protein
MLFLFQPFRLPVLEFLHAKQNNMKETSSAEPITFELKEAGMISSGGRVLSFSLLTFLFLGGVMPAAARNGAQADFCEQVKPCQLLAKSDAERMLGQSARLTQDTSVLKGDVRQCLCAYTGVSTDTESGQTSVLYFSLEQKAANPSAEQARRCSCQRRKRMHMTHRYGT